MNARERQAYWRQNERILRQLDRKYKPLFLRVLQRMTDRFIAKANRYEGQFLDEELVSVYARLYREVVIRYGNEQYRRMYKIKSFGFNAEWTQQVNEWLATEGFRLVTTVSGNMRAVILKLIAQATQEGVEQGLGADDVSRLIIERLEAFKSSLSANFIAERIVRTETMRAANMGHMMGAQKLRYEVLKMWIASRDERTRRMPRDQFSHVALDGQTRELDEPFRQVGMNGQEAVAMQPGDATAPAGFTINCRCTVAFIPKRDANGRVIRRQG